MALALDALDPAFTGIVLSQADYSLYAEPIPDQGDRQALGMRENPRCHERANPGRAGSTSQSEVAP
jgi:hypothetical protein